MAPPILVDFHLNGSLPGIDDEWVVQEPGMPYVTRQRVLARKPHLKEALAW